MTTSEAQSQTRIQLENGWQQQLAGQFEQDYMRQLKRFLQQQKQAGQIIYPPPSQWFAAFNQTPFAAVKVVILGQDPYHGPGQAHGLSFSVPPGIAIPPSLRNIFRELASDLDIPLPAQGCLQGWAEQGVLLLNSCLTVEQGQAGAHQGKGWELFTDAAVAALNQQRENLVFLLWGSHAQRKGALIDRQRHCVLTAPHPSPLSAHRGFFGCRHFSQANHWLQQQGQTPIDWQLAPQ